MEQWTTEVVDQRFIDQASYVEFLGNDGRWSAAFSVRSGTTYFPVTFKLTIGSKVYLARGNRIRDSKDPSGNTIIRKVRVDDRSYENEPRR